MLAKVTLSVGMEDSFRFGLIRITLFIAVIAELEIGVSAGVVVVICPAHLVDRDC